jgi:hypothetical protein
MSINLAPGDKLQLITGQVSSVDVLVSYHDRVVDLSAFPVANPQGSSIMLPGYRSFVNITGATTTDIQAGPTPTSPTFSREVDNIMLTNVHAANSVDVTPILLSGGVAYRIGVGKTTLLPGQSLQWSTAGWITPAAGLVQLAKYLAADDALLNQNTVQPVFPTAGGVTVLGNTTYLMEGRYAMSKPGAGGNTHTTALSFAGGATLTNIDYIALTFSTAAATIGALSTAPVGAVVRVAVATSTVINATSVLVEANIYIRGVLRTNAGGTFIPQFTWSADPTGACKILRGSFFTLTQTGLDKTGVNVGTWA